MLKRFIFNTIQMLIVMAGLIAGHSVAFAGEVAVGASRIALYHPMMEGKRVALLSNHTGIVNGRHTLDIMLEHGINVVTLFSPEHGFRGTADAGEHIKSGVDPVTGIPVASLYSGGKNTPDPKVMEDIDVIAVDLQDVGTRFYTYYITMLNLIEAAARHDIPVIVLDRPNQLGMSVDGPVLDMRLRSGVGRLPIPVLHGMTMGELAMMANGEGWLNSSLKADITVIPCTGYTHATRYELPVAPSPNLRDMTAIYLYPSLCFFEGTAASVGRGTDRPFKIYGHPAMRNHNFAFTPQSMPGAKNPPLLGKRCLGTDLSSSDVDSMISAGVNLQYIIDAYSSMPEASKARFFSPFFDKLIGNTRVRQMIISGRSADDIKSTWADEVVKFRKLRAKYLLYPEK